MSKRAKRPRAARKNGTARGAARFALGFNGAPLVFEPQLTVATATASAGPAPAPTPPNPQSPQPVQPAAGPSVRSTPPRRRETRQEGLVGVGVVAGGHLRDWFNTTGLNSGSAFDDRSARFMIGPTVQFNLSPRYLLEFDAIRRGFGARTTGNIFGVGFASNSSGSSWEFPAIFKRRFIASRHVKPFLGAGVALRRVSQNSSVTALNDVKNSTSNSQGSISVGIPISAGMDFRTGVLHFTPELRYTLWTADKSFAPIRTPGLYDANPNQVALILGFTIN